MAKRQKDELGLYYWRLYCALCDILDQGVKNLDDAKAKLLQDPRFPTCDDLSRVIGRIEEAVGQGPGLTLIDRTRGKVSVTPEGRELYNRFGDLLGRYEETVELMAKGRKRVTIGTTATLGHYLLPLILRQTAFFGSDAHTAVDLRILERGHDEWHDLLVVREVVDFVLAPTPHKGSYGSTKQLRELKRLFLYPAQGPLFELFKRLAPDGSNFVKADLRKVPVLHLPREVYHFKFVIDEWLPPPVKGGRRIEIQHQSVMRSWVANGAGVGIMHDLPLELMQREESLIRWVDLSRHIAPSYLNLSFRDSAENPALSEPARALVSAIETYCREQWDRPLRRGTV